MSYNDANSLTKYYELICKQPLLSREEERRLIEIIYDKTGDFTPKQKKAAADKLIQSNLRFVFKKAKIRSRGDIEQFEELISAGNIGLLKTLDKYNPNSGYRFLSYAGWWVMQQQLKEMSQMRLVSLPVQKQQLAARIRKKQEEFGRPMTLEELKAAFPQNKEKDLKELSQTSYLTYYIDDFEREDSFAHELEESIIEDLDREDIALAINSLPSPMKEVIELSFGMDDGHSKKITEVAKELGIKKDEVKRLRTEGLMKLSKIISPDIS